MAKDQTVHDPADIPEGQYPHIGSRGGLYYAPDKRANLPPSHSSGEIPEECLERAGVSIGFFKGSNIGEYRVRISKTAPYSREAYEKIKKEYQACHNLRQAIDKVQGDY